MRLRPEQVGLEVANAALIMNGPDVTGVESTFFGWGMVALAILSCIAIMGGAIGCRRLARQMAHTADEIRALALYIQLIDGRLDEP